MWSLGRPQARMGHRQVHVYAPVAADRGVGRLLHPSLWVDDRHLHGQSALPLGILDLGVDRQGGGGGVSLCCAQERQPGVEAYRRRDHKPDGAVESRAGIPAAALRLVVQADGKRVVARMQVGRDVHPEGRVAIGPRAGPPAVDIDHGLCHGTVKLEGGAPSRQVAHGERRGVIASSDPGQGTRPSGLLGLLLLAVLHDGHRLQVPLLVKRAADGPVVRHADGVPQGAVA